MNMNKTFFIGFLGSDPEIRYTQTGTAVAEFSLAVKDGWGDKQKTYWPRLVAFGKTAEMIGNSLSKGRKIMAECRYTQDNYEKDGQKKRSSKFVVEHIEFLDSKKQEQEPSKDFNPNSFGSDTFPEEEIPW
jgi:single-strand DNA-binding protein